MKAIVTLACSMMFSILCVAQPKQKSVVESDVSHNYKRAVRESFYKELNNLSGLEEGYHGFIDVGYTFGVGAYQNYYHGERAFNYRKPKQNSSDITALDIANITYADEDGDGALEKDESAQIYFDLINTGEEPLYGITPVLMPNKTKHIQISTPCIIDSLQGKHALRYIIEMQGDGKTNPGNLQLVLRIKYGQANYSDVEVIGLGTKRRKE